ncbi:MAG: MauE/DoxX family redox-associated membrane protein, partial [Fibrobacterota bacterium]
LCLFFRIYLGFVFIEASIHKIADPHSFALDIASYGILPLYLVNLQAIILPWLELFSGSMFIIGFRVRANALLIAGMMVMFMTALGIALFKGLDMSCGCFASAEAEASISWLTMLRDLGWLLPAVYVYFFDKRPLGADSLL